MGGQELSLRGAGLREVPLEVWQAGPGLGKLDLSDNPVSEWASCRIWIWTF